MSDDFESDDDVPEIYSPTSSTNGHSGAAVGAENGQAANGEEDKRAHHNALERRRRDHIKDSFVSLKRAVPPLQGERSSRALVLKKTCDYIIDVQARIRAQQEDVAELRRQNDQLDAQLRAFEGARRLLEARRYPDAATK